MRIKVELFTSPTCPHCPKAEREVRAAIRGQEDIRFEKYKVTSGEGKRKAEDYRIIGVPALVINGELFKGNITEERVRKKIEEIRSGKKKGFFSKLFG